MPLPNVINIVLWSGYLDTRDRSNYSMVCVKAAQKLLSTESILEGISHSPVKEAHRFQFWRWAIGRELDYSIFEPLHGGDTVGYYLHHRALLTSATTKKTSGQLGEIMRDVGRTYPDHPFFNSKKNQPGEILLARVLCATLSSTPNIGYCQGMNFVVATLLLARIPKSMMEESYREADKQNQELRENSPSPNGEEGDNSTSTKSLNATDSFDDANICEYDDIEADVFWMFQSILIKNDHGLEMEFIWKPSFPKMKLRVFQFDRLLQLYLPTIHAHFEDMSLSPEVVVSQWFMTLFSNTLPLSFTLYMWDYVFVSNWAGIFRATLAILSVLQSKLLEMDLEEVGLLIRDWKRGNFDIPVTFSELLCCAETFPVDLASLVMLQENYALEMIVAAVGDKLDISSSIGKSYHGGCMGLPKPGAESWLRRHGEFPAEMRSEMLLIHDEINDMSIQVDRDKAVLQNKILKACELCENAYDDLDKAIREEMKWLQYTSNLKHELCSWEKKAKSALSELKWANENEKQSSMSSSSYEEEDDDDESDEDEDDDSYDSYEEYSGSESSSSGEYMEEDGSCSDDEEYVDDEDLDSDSYETSDSGTPPKGSGGGGSYFFDAVTNMTNLLIPVTAQPLAAAGKQTAVDGAGQDFVVQAIGPQRTECDDHLKQSESNHVKTSDIPSSPRSSTPHSTYSSSPEVVNLPISSTTVSLAQKIKSHPNRRRTSSTPGLKPQTDSPGNSPITTPVVTVPTTLVTVDEVSEANGAVYDQGLASHITPSPSSSPSGNSRDIVDRAQPSPTELTSGVMPIVSSDANRTKVKTPKSPSRFQSFTSNVLKRTNSSGGGGRIGFSRRYITSKLERRKAKILKAKECHFLHKKIIKSSKQFEIAKKRLIHAKEDKQTAMLADEEAKQWKEKLCDQYSCLVKGVDVLKSQKLIYIVDTYGM